MRTTHPVFAAFLLLGVSACARSDDAALPRSEADAQGAEIPAAEVVTTRNGRVDLTLTAAPAEITVAGRTFTSNVYNGSYIPPVLRVRRGDAVRVTLVNAIDSADIQIDRPQPSNVHYHGMSVPPKEPGDNVYISIPSRAAAPADTLMRGHVGRDPTLLKASPRYEYRWTVPLDHPQGLHWYHPHRDPYLEPQVLSGMSGMLVVEGLVPEHYPELASAKLRTLMLKDIALPGSADTAPKTKTINGMACGTLRTRPGALEIWEVGNLGADAFFDITVDGHRFWVLERDGNILERPDLVQSLFLPPSARATIAIKAGEPGAYGVRSLEIDTGPAGDPNPSVRLASLVVEGAPVDDATMLSRLARPAAHRETITPTIEAVRAARITRQRRLVYTESADGNTFFLNGREFDPDRIDTEASLGDVEEWTLVNETGERHTFHIHQVDFLVTAINGEDEDAKGLRDNIDIPYRDPVTGRPGEVKLIIPFTNPTIVGKFPYHCHILEHEDAGMMANMVVRPRR